MNIPNPHHERLQMGKKTSNQMFSLLSHPQFIPPCDAIVVILSFIQTRRNPLIPTFAFQSANSNRIPPLTVVAFDAFTPTTR